MEACCKLLVLLWVCGVVIEANTDVEKRDVHHKIVIKGRRARRQPNRHHTHDGIQFDHHHDHYGSLEAQETYPTVKYSSRGKYKPRVHNYELGRDSFEDSGPSYSHEATYRKKPKHKLKQSHSHRKPVVKSKPPPPPPHSFISSEEFDDSRSAPFQNQWSPIVSSEIPKPTNIFESSGDNLYRPSKNQQRYTKSPLNIELTTSFPQKTQTFYESPNFPSVLDQPYFEYDKGADQYRPPQAIQDLSPLSDQQKQHYYSGSQAYQVHENHNYDNVPKEQNSYKALAPSLDMTHAQLMDASSNVNVEVKKEEEPKKVTKSTGRGRGRFKTKM